MQPGYGGWLWRLVKETGHAGWVRRLVMETGQGDRSCSLGTEAGYVG